MAVHPIPSAWLFLQSSLTQCLMNLIKVIAKFKDNEEIAFLFVGEGSVSEQLKSYVERHELANVYSPVSSSSSVANT